METPTSKPFHVSHRAAGIIALAVLLGGRITGWWPDSVWAQRILDLLELAAWGWNAYFTTKGGTKIEWIPKPGQPPTTEG